MPKISELLRRRQAQTLPSKLTLHQSVLPHAGQGSSRVTSRHSPFTLPFGKIAISKIRSKPLALVLQGASLGVLFLSQCRLSMFFWSWQDDHFRTMPLF